ncbi:uncharacterized protein LOC126778192 [Nymphalis io]|uniref:uncharacterized protein LOC126778192 n=1 Tax=Inachis io TaxID=171585 RepID=UPI0021692070|nr:uncharacterized protein LOC126778192 [Nymphalis io]
MKLFHFYRQAFCIFLLAQSLFIAVRSISIATIVPPKVNRVLQRANISDVNLLINGSRRIINGEESGNSRPYMVYLKLPSSNVKFNNYRHWLCGGVIIHDEYILTSAACIEDAKHFYVVSGTHRHNEEDDRHNNDCVKNGAKKAVWKCIPRNYVFDGHENDNIRWMNNDIAIVKVEDEFDFTRRIRGCDFIPKPICYNNQSSTYENPDNRAIIAGWGTTEKYNDWVNRRSQSITQELLETTVVLISKKHCKRRWGSRYHNIIDNYMICSKDINTELSDVCNDKYVECTDIMYSDEDEGTRRILNPEKLVLHSAFHNESGRRQTSGGGFCENDHGGPLIYGEGSNAMVIGIISACLVKERTNKCYGPFLYTSVYKNRVLINCAIYKDVRGDCSKLFRSSKSYREEHMNWSDHPDGPAMHEVAKMRRIRANSRTAALETMKYENSTLGTFYDHAEMRLENTNISSTK